MRVTLALVLAFSQAGTGHQSFLSLISLIGHLTKKKIWK